MRSTLIKPRHIAAAVILVIAVLRVPAVAQPQVTKTEPPNWWTGFVSPVMVLLYGENLNDARFSVSYPGVKVEKTQSQPDGKHAFIWLSIAKTAKPGTINLVAKTSSGTTSAAFPLLTR